MPQKEISVDPYSFGRTSSKNFNVDGGNATLQLTSRSDLLSIHLCSANFANSTAIGSRK